jgi:hypothetical protein
MAPLNNLRISHTEFEVFCIILRSVSSLNSLYLPENSLIFFLTTTEFGFQTVFGFFWLSHCFCNYFELSICKSYSPFIWSSASFIYNRTMFNWNVTNYNISSPPVCRTFLESRCYLFLFQKFWAISGLETGTVNEIYCGFPHPFKQIMDSNLK